MGRGRGAHAPGQRAIGLLPWGGPAELVSLLPGPFSLPDEGLWDILIKDIPKEVTSYTFSMDILKQGVSYDFRVIAVNDYGYGTPSTPSPSVSGSLGGQHMGMPGGMGPSVALFSWPSPKPIPNPAWLLQSPKSRCQQHLPLQNLLLSPSNPLPHVDPGLIKFPKVTPCPAGTSPHPY